MMMTVQLSVDHQCPPYNVQNLQNEAVHNRKHGEPYVDCKNKVLSLDQNIAMLSFVYIMLMLCLVEVCWC